MNKLIITMLCILVAIGGIISAIILYQPETGNNNEILIREIAQEEILDECTDEYEQMQEQEMIEANAIEEKISPNCFITEKTYYKKCGHTTNKYVELPKELVNQTKKEAQEKYPDYEIEKFESNNIVLYKEKEGECGEHFLVKDNEGTVTIYQILENGTKKEYEATDITTEYLPETDKINMHNGIEVIGKQELNQLIENFE